MPSDPIKPPVYTKIFFCNSVLEDTEGLLTAIKIADIYHVPPMRLQETLPDGTKVRSVVAHPPLQIAAILMFHSEAPVSFEATVVGIDPRGKRLEINGGRSIPVTINGGVEGYALNINLIINSEHAGDLWFEVYVGEALATKAPLRILKQPLIEESQGNVAGAPIPARDSVQG